MKRKLLLLLFIALFNAKAETIKNENILLQKALVTGNLRFELDEFNRNMVVMDKETIANKGYKKLEDVFASLPFVGLVDSGLGKNLDIRGQGNKANTSVQVLVNGIPLNMLDSSHGVTPLNTIDMNLIESIEILPGGGAVMYGNGTRGGVVNIVTNKHYEKPYFRTGVNYSNISKGGKGNSVDANMQYGNKNSKNTYYSLGANYINQQGPRISDKMHGAGVNFGLSSALSGSENLFFRADIFRANITSSPNNSFLDNLKPKKKDRGLDGRGRFDNAQLRMDYQMGYENEISSSSFLELKGFYHYNRIDYLDTKTLISRFTFNGQTLNDVLADQSGSLFDDQKIGINGKYRYNYDNGLLILGIQSLYNMSKRTMEATISATSPRPIPPTMNTLFYHHPMNIPFEGNKWNSSLYAFNKYNLTDNFSLSGGARIEYAKYDIEVSNNQDIKIMGRSVSTINASGDLREHLWDFALEFVPNYRYSPTGNLYGKYERGYVSPSPNSLLRREARSNFYIPTNLKSETYDTFEIGIRDSLGDILMGTFSAYYTLSNDEFYTIGTAHSPLGVEYGSYDKTERKGFEIYLEESLFSNLLSFNQSLAYVDSRVKKNNGISVKDKIPYVSAYKATFNADYKIDKNYNVWIANSFIGRQSDSGQNKINSYSLTDIGVNAKFGNFSLGAGVKNLFDKFYYQFYNKDSSDVITGYSYLLGQGRTFFLNTRYEF